MLQLCVTGVTFVMGAIAVCDWCYSCVCLVLLFCATGATGVGDWCYSYVTGVEDECNWCSYSSVW